MAGKESIDLEKKYYLQVFGRPDFVLDHGEGVHLFDTDGNKYLDFVSGLAVNALGYGHPTVVNAIKAQAEKLIHVTNLYHTSPAPELSRLLCENSFADRVFLSNSGTEAVEAALKFARKWAYKKYADSPKTGFVSMDHSFHGRTFGALAATGQPKYHQGFGPMLPGASFAQMNDLESVEKVVNAQTAAVLVEPLQAEGGVHPGTKEFLKGLRDLCDSMGALLIFDEIQVGMGRTGTLWCHEQFDVTPDIMTVAKPLGGGLPIGATLMTQDVADAIAPGDHGGTFGANPVVCAVAIEVFKTLSDPAFLKSVKEKGDYMAAQLKAVAERHPDKITEVRGMGMIQGVVVKDIASGDIVAKARESKLLLINAGPDVVRFLPPLIAEKEHIDEAVAGFEKALG